MSFQEFLNNSSAAVSALASLIAAFAALNSARSATDAQKSLIDSNHAAALLKIAETANSVVVKAHELGMRADELKLLCRSCFIKNGSIGSSREQLSLKYIEDMKSKIKSCDDYAKLFNSFDSTLKSSTIEDINRVQFELSKRKKEIEAVSILIDAQFAVYRNS
jgi:hypothetical protein